MTNINGVNIRQIFYFISQSLYFVIILFYMTHRSLSHFRLRVKHKFKKLMLDGMRVQICEYTRGNSEVFGFHSS